MIAPKPILAERQFPHLTRQLDLYNPEIYLRRINVIGAGAIGSYLVHHLAKSGFTDIHVWDDDNVEIENYSVSMYRKDQVGKKKLDALQELLELKLTLHHEKYTEKTGLLPGVIIMAADSMAVRKMIWKIHAGSAARTEAIIDTRMGAQIGQWFFFDPMKKDDDEAFDALWFDDDMAIPEPCTARGTTWCAAGLTADLTQSIMSFLNGKVYVTQQIANYKLHARHIVPSDFFEKLAAQAAEAEKEADSKTESETPTPTPSPDAIINEASEPTTESALSTTPDYTIAIV